MRIIVIGLTLLTLALGPRPAGAQQPGSSDAGGPGKSGATPDERMRAMYEDIEILRRLLIREVRAAYGPAEGVAFSPDGKLISAAHEPVSVAASRQSRMHWRIASAWPPLRQCSAHRPAVRTTAKHSSMHRSMSS